MKITHEQGDPRDLVLLEENARFMTHEVFARLVANIRRDGVLQQWPFVHLDPATGVRTVWSGNHRVQAAMQAGLDVIDWTQCDEHLTLDQLRAIQLSHNAIAGEDDPATLRRIYASIDDVDERMATGLSDLELGLLDAVDTSGLSEANLDFTTVAIVFLPSEAERARNALDDARRAAGADERWIARFDQHAGILDAIEDARSAAHVMNVATALDVLLDVWDAHREDLAGLWLDDAGEPTLPAKNLVPVTSVLGLTMHAGRLATVRKALEKVVARGDATDRTDALGWLAERYLADPPKE